MKKLTLFAALLFSLTWLSSAADAGWKEKLSSAGFAYCLKENDFDHDTQLWAYNRKTGQTEYLERNALICKGQDYSENSISGYLSNGNYWRWEGNGSLICMSGPVLMGAKAKGTPYCHRVHKLNSKPERKSKSASTSKASTQTSPLEKIENKCTELGFTKGTEKHGDCVMKLYEEPEDVATEIPKNIITCNFNNLEIYGDRAGDGRLQLVLEKSGRSWVLLKVQGAKNASSDAREWFNTLFALKSQNTNYYDVQYKPDDVRGFPFGDSINKKRGSLNFSVKLDTGMLVRLEASREALFSLDYAIKGLDRTDLFDARGTCVVPPSAVASDAPPAPVRKNSPFKYDADGHVTGQKDLGFLHISGDFIKNGGGYENGGKRYFVGKDGTRYFVGTAAVFHSLSAWQQAYLIAARRSEK